MSFDVFLITFGETERTGISRQVVRALFPVVEKTSGPDSWVIAYDKDNRCRIDVKALASDDDALIRIGVERPCGDSRLWQSLFQVLKMGHIFMVWPGGRPVVASMRNAAFLPEQLDALGLPQVVGSAEALLSLVRDS